MLLTVLLRCFARRALNGLTLISTQLALFAFSAIPASAQPSWPAGLPEVETLPVKPCPGPVWPLEVRRKVKASDAEFQLLLSAHGDVEDVRVVKSTGFDVIDNAVTAALRRCSFVPAVKGHELVESTTRAAYQWVSGLVGQAGHPIPPAVFADEPAARLCGYFDPSYRPREAPAAGTAMRLRFDYDEATGQLLKASVEQSSGYPELDEAVRSSFLHCNLRAMFGKKLTGSPYLFEYRPFGP